MLRVSIAGFILALAGGVHAQLEVIDAYVRGLPPGQAVTAAFMTLRNSGDHDVVLTSANSSVADTLEFHQHSHEGGMMRMRQVPELRVPAGGELHLEPGQLHLMLMGLKQPLVDGERVTIELCSESDSCLVTELKVISVLNES